MKKLFLSVCLMASAMLFASEPSEVLRAYNCNGGGYVIMDSENEVVGFSEKGELTAANVSDLFFLGAPIEIIDVPSGIEPLVGFPAPVQDSIGPLLGDIAYNQGKPYNNMAPLEDGARCMTGCVATAMAMIARYWQWPKVCNDGEVSYTPAN
ncbi:MAG: C10 family peptidase, partial [Paludibacteraceae bacterium]|nr:C10 family peptidase [Paludibacteraceae bacterium]